MFLGLAAEAEGLQRVFGASARALDHGGPAAVVGLAEFREEPGQGGVGRSLHLVVQICLKPFGATTLDDLGCAGNLRHQRPQIVACLVAPRLHALASLCAFGG